MMKVRLQPGRNVGYYFIDGPKAVLTDAEVAKLLNEANKKLNMPKGEQPKEE